MTTIGYGDIYPVTNQGRFIIVLAAIWGIFMVALFITILEEVTKLDSDQDDAYEEMVQQQTIKSKLKKDAGQLIAHFWRLKLAKKRGKSLKERFLCRMDLMAMVMRFK